MLMSLGVVLAVVLFVVFVLPRPHYDAVKPIDPTQMTQILTSAKRAAPYHLRVPTGLPDRWRPTSADVTGPNDRHVVHLHIGYVTPANDYAALEESNDARVPFIELETAHGKLTGQRVVAGQVWETRYSANQKENSLDLTGSDGVTMIVTGNASYDELAELTASLR